MKTCMQRWSWALMMAIAVFLQGGRLLAQDDQNSDNGAPSAEVQNSLPNADGQDQPDQADQNSDQDPPGRVADLNYSQGSISYRPANQDEWISGVPNGPLVTGDDLWADESSRAEVHIGSTAIRIGSKTGITFLNLDDHTTQIRLAQGKMILRVRHVDDDDAYEVDTPNLAFTILQPGEYRFDVGEDAAKTTITVWSGRGRAVGGGSSYTVVAQQSAVFTGTDSLNYELDQVPDPDDFDIWAFDRDKHEDNSESANYVSREMTGYEDLDEYGDWSYVAGYGPCWRPYMVGAGWAPYRVGRWAFVAPWGWTWVGGEPWGFAPYHYGRWAFVGGGWFWVPGPAVVRPVWAPALVAWVGGPGFRVGVGAGVGWFPLAPGEVYIPAYRVSRAYVNNVNVTNTNVSATRITNVYNTTVIDRNTTVNRVAYVNEHVNGGVTVVSHDTFVNARPVAQNVVHVDQRQLQAAAPTTRFSPAQPVRASVLGGEHPAAVKPPASVINRQVVAERMPPRAFSQGGSGGNQTVRVETGPTRPAPVQDGAHPLARLPQGQQREEAQNVRVRPAPPVQSNPQQEQQKAQKFRKWQQKRQPASRQQRSSPAPRGGGGYRGH